MEKAIQKLYEHPTTFDGTSGGISLLDFLELLISKLDYLD